MKSFRVRDNCRLCFSNNLTNRLSLPDTPLANEFVTFEQTAIPQDTFPLYLLTCDVCSHVQLPIVVDPSRLFSNYVYVSGTASSFVQHLQKLAADCIIRFQLGAGDFVVEIGSNDGTALLPFKQAGIRVLGIDPAIEIGRLATQKGVPTLPEFFDQGVAAKVVEQFGKAKLVIANNVFAHSDDLHSIVEGIVHLLHPKVGRFVFEVQYVLDMLQNSYFDMIYHEHLSYHSVKPLVGFLRKFGLYIQTIERIDTHGGSIRVTCGFEAREATNLTAMIGDEEAFFLDGKPFSKLLKQIDTARLDVEKLVANTQNKIWGFGAPAKLTTLCYSLNLASVQLEAIIDDNPLKQGLFSPGLHVPIVSSNEFAKRAHHNGEDIIIFAWNFADSIASMFHGEPHRLYTPLPKLKKITKNEPN